MLHEGRLFLVGMSWRREVLNYLKHFGSSNGFLVDDRLLEAEHHAGADTESKGGLPPITLCVGPGMMFSFEKPNIMPGPTQRVKGVCPPLRWRREPTPFFRNRASGNGLR